jgi:hypothetical protein
MQWLGLALIKNKQFFAHSAARCMCCMNILWCCIVQDAAWCKLHAATRCMVLHVSWCCMVHGATRCVVHGAEWYGMVHSVTIMQNVASTVPQKSYLAVNLE